MRRTGSQSMASFEPARWENEAALIEKRFAASRDAGMPRYLQLHASVVDLVRSDALKPGAQMPPEQHLAATLGISLGTVQKGLQSLSAQGFIVREHGRGTFISERRRNLTELRHFRFLDPSNGELLPVYARLLDRRIVTQNPDLEGIFGPDPEGHISLTRLIDVGGKFFCHSELFLPASRFAAIMTLHVEQLENVNLKILFEDTFGIATFRLDQNITMAKPTAAIASLVGVGARTSGMVLEARGRAYDGTVFSFQRIFIPPSRFPLDIADGAGLDHVRPARHG